MQVFLQSAESCFSRSLWAALPHVTRPLESSSRHARDKEEKGKRRLNVIKTALTSSNPTGSQGTHHLTQVSVQTFPPPATAPSTLVPTSAFPFLRLLVATPSGRGRRCEPGASGQATWLPPWASVSPPITADGNSTQLMGCSVKGLGQSLALSKCH